MSVLSVIIACGLLAIVYGIWAIFSVLRADQGTPKMQEIAAANPVGRKNRAQSAAKRLLALRCKEKFGSRAAS